MSRIWMILLVDDEMVLLWGVWRVSVCALARLHCAAAVGWCGGACQSDRTPPTHPLNCRAVLTGGAAARARVTFRSSEAHVHGNR